MKKVTNAIILFSGGVDSTVMLAMALAEEKNCHAISFDYGQRHLIELEAAKQIAAHYRVPHQVVKIDPLFFQGSALLSGGALPQGRSVEEITHSSHLSSYVPARNTLFLAYATAMAEAIEAQEIHFGPTQMDQAAYVDCRPAFISAYQALLNLSTRRAVEGQAPQLVTPLISWRKREVILKGRALQAPLELSWSCYQPTEENRPCTFCDACTLRQEAWGERETR